MMKKTAQSQAIDISKKYNLFFKKKKNKETKSKVYISPLQVDRSDGLEILENKDGSQTPSDPKNISSPMIDSIKEKSSEDAESPTNIDDKLF